MSTPVTEAEVEAEYAKQIAMLRQKVYASLHERFCRGETPHTWCFMDPEEASDASYIPGTIADLNQNTRGDWVWSDNAHAGDLSDGGAPPPEHADARESDDDSDDAESSSDSDGSDASSAQQDRPPAAAPDAQDNSESDDETARMKSPRRVEPPPDKSGPQTDEAGKVSEEEKKRRERLRKAATEHEVKEIHRALGETGRRETDPDRLDAQILKAQYVKANQREADRIYKESKGIAPSFNSISEEVKRSEEYKEITATAFKFRQNDAQDMYTGSCRPYTIILMRAINRWNKTRTNKSAKRLIKESEMTEERQELAIWNAQAQIVDTVFKRIERELNRAQKNTNRTIQNIEITSQFADAYAEVKEWLPKLTGSEADGEFEDIASFKEDADKKEDKRQADNARRRAREQEKPKKTKATSATKT